MRVCWLRGCTILRAQASALLAVHILNPACRKPTWWHTHPSENMSDHHHKRNSNNADPSPMAAELRITMTRKKIPPRRWNTKYSAEGPAMIWKWGNVFNPANTKISLAKSFASNDLPVENLSNESLKEMSFPPLSYFYRFILHTIPWQRFPIILLSGMVYKNMASNS